MFDYVIVGAGTAGCMLAARLSENPRARVLLLEAGGPDTRREIRIPAAFPNLFKTECDWALTTEPQPRLAGRSLFWPRGKVLGGSSSINAMIYIRGHFSDYDAWAAAGNAGWSWHDMLPCFLRGEDNARGASDAHGSGGPLRVEDQLSPHPLSLAFLDACAETGIERNSDFNGPEQEGAGLYQVTQRGGRRCSAADACLRPALKRKNLGVRTGAQVLRVLFDRAQAVGVEYLHEGQRRVASATREIILCGGAVHSPHLLLASGVGPAADLEPLGIQVVADVPGVGANLQDHLVVPVVTETSGADTLDGADNLLNLAWFSVTRRGKLRSILAEAGAFVRSRAGLAAPDLQFHFVPACWLDHAFERPRGRFFTLGVTQLRPASRGRITLRSADPLDPPRVDPRYLDAEGDLSALLAGVGIARQILSARPLRKWSKAERFPGQDARDDAALAAWIAKSAQTLYHPAGSCRMGPDSDPMAVVDNLLRVRRVAGLRVADASVMPALVGGNTNAPVFAIAERAASLIYPPENRMR
jgi:choline dehydrogenase